jgi:transcriptional regulator with XRE-family HTH domain
MVRGTKPNLHRLQLMTRLRASGLSLTKIARQLGVSRQAVHDALTRRRVPRRPAICCNCRAAIPAAEVASSSRKLVCLDCLANVSHIPFAKRLASMRIIAGLTQVTLARATEFSQSLISKLEAGEHQPKPETRQRLLAFLGRTLAKQKNSVGQMQRANHLQQCRRA